MGGKSRGFRSGTRHMFARAFRHKGMLNLSTYMRTFKIGDFVDIKVDGAMHKGMPHKFYHGKTGRVINVTPRALGVEVNKEVGNRIMKKRISVRLEHVKQSKCRDEFLERVKQSQKARQEKGAHVPLKRQPKQPREGGFVKVKKDVVALHALKFVEIF